MSADHRNCAYVLNVGGKLLDANGGFDGEPLVMDYRSAMFAVSVAHHFWVDDVEDLPDIQLHAEPYSSNTDKCVLTLRPKLYGGM